MTTRSHPARGHVREAERILANLGSLGIAEEVAVRGAAAAVDHALPAIAATLADHR